MKMKTFLGIIACLLYLCMNSMYADMATGAYLKRIKKIENMLDQTVAMDEQYVQTTLQNLLAKTTSPNRVERIQRAQNRFNDYLQARNEAQPNVSPQQAAAIIKHDEEEDEEDEGGELPVQSGVVPGAPLPPVPTPVPSPVEEQEKAPKEAVEHGQEEIEIPTPTPAIARAIPSNAPTPKPSAESPTASPVTTSAGSAGQAEAPKQSAESDLLKQKIDSLIKASHDAADETFQINDLSLDDQFDHFKKAAGFASDAHQIAKQADVQKYIQTGTDSRIAEIIQENNERDDKIKKVVQKLEKKIQDSQNKTLIDRYTTVVKKWNQQIDALNSDGLTIHKGTLVDNSKALNDALVSPTAKPTQTPAASASTISAPTPKPSATPSTASTPMTSAGSAGQAEADQQAKISAARSQISNLEKDARNALATLAQYDGKKSLEWSGVQQFATEIDAADKIVSHYLSELDLAERDNLLDPKENDESKDFVLTKMAFYQKLYDDLTAPESASKKEVEEPQKQQNDPIIKQLQAIIDTANTLEQSNPITKTVFNNTTKLANKTFVSLLDQMDEDRRKNTLIVVVQLAIKSIQRFDDRLNLEKQTKSVTKTIKDLAQHLIKAMQEKNSLQQLQKMLADDVKSDTNDLKKLLDESAQYSNLSYEIFKAELIKKDAFEAWNTTYHQITRASQTLNTEDPKSKEYKEAIQQLKNATKTLKKLVDARIDEIAKEKAR